MSYELSDNELWQWGQDATFGATSVTHWIMGPKGKTGVIRDIVVDVTTAVTWGSMSAPAEIAIGLTPGDTTFGRYRLGANLSTGYAVGPHRAGDEPITGNPPRTLADFAGHVVLDGGPVTSQGVAGGTYGTVVPLGRIPAGPLTVTNVINGTGNVPRIFLAGLTAGPGGFQVLQTVLVKDIAGATGSNGQVVISAIDTASPPQWIETSGTFGGTYTSGGSVMPMVAVLCKAGTGGSPAGGGHVRVKVQWQGPETP